ncbi:hypothetical protein BDV3_001041 [Batrachochytrium dendrobatidis]
MFSARFILSRNSIYSKLSIKQNLSIFSSDRLLSTSWQQDLIETGESIALEAPVDGVSIRLLSNSDIAPDLTTDLRNASRTDGQTSGNVKPTNKASKSKSKRAHVPLQNLLSEIYGDTGEVLPSKNAIKRRAKINPTVESATLESSDFKLTKLDVGAKSPPRLKHGLERVLFSPGPVFLQDPRTGVFNFDKTLNTIPAVESFDYSKLNPYTIASKDKVLKKMAIKYKRKYYASTSSITSVLSKLILSITGMRPVNLDRLSIPFIEKSALHTKFSCGPTGIVLKYSDGVYGIDHYKPSEETRNVLMQLGHVLEAMLCEDKKSFKRLLKTDNASTDITLSPSTYSYSLAENFLMRAQLDCQHPDLPNKSFDIKTRATAAIRFNSNDYQSHTGYKIRKLTGVYESFEREYFDMLRSTFLKYSLQVRIGKMDGIFVSYHNTASIYGFQYIPLEQMDEDLFGNSTFADDSFAFSVKLFNRLLDIATARFPKRDLKIIFDEAKEQSIVCVIQPACSLKGSAKRHIAKSNSDMSSASDKSELSEWDASRAVRFQIKTRSIINDINVEGLPFVKHDAGDKWELHYDILDAGVTDKTVSRAEKKLVGRTGSSKASGYFLNEMRINSIYEEELGEKPDFVNGNDTLGKEDEAFTGKDVHHGINGTD